MKVVTDQLGRSEIVGDGEVEGDEEVGFSIRSPFSTGTSLSSKLKKTIKKSKKFGPDASFREGVVYEIRDLGGRRTTFVALIPKLSPYPITLQTVKVGI